MKQLFPLILLAGVPAGGASAQSAQQSDRHAAGPAGHDHHAMAMPAAAQLGSISFPNTGAPAAQVDFLEGVKLLHNFGYEEAIAAFQCAQQADPGFLLAYWGEAMAHNYTLWAEQHVDAARAALAKLAPTPAERATKAKAPRELMYLEAIEAMYGSGTKAERDAAYAARMDALAKAYPTDVEAQVFDGLAIMGLSNGTRNVANYMRAAARLETLFPTHRQHPGVVHYLIHAYDDPAHARQGLEVARLYDKVAPDSPHAQHMTSHIFLALGMWPEVEQANINARAAVERRVGHPVPRASCGHGAMWLVYARLQQGKPVADNIDECARATAPSLAKASSTPSVAGEFEDGSGSHADMRARNFVETGQMAAPLPLPSGQLNVARFIYEYADVLAARHDAAKAGSALAALTATHAILASTYAKEHPDDDQSMPWMALILTQAKGVAALAAGKRAEGMQILRAAAERETALPAVFGPPPLPKPGWELLGDELLAAGDNAAAAAAYRESLKLQPGRRLSLAGLAKAGR